MRNQKVILPDYRKSCSLADLRKYSRGLSAPLAVDLFSGAGGMSLGLENAGFQVILGVDYDRSAIATHRAYFGGCSLEADLSDPCTLEEIVSSLAGVRISLLAAGPPCQPFSMAGRGKVRSLAEGGGRVHDDRRELWSSVIEIAGKLLPKTVLIENVPGMAQGEDVKVVGKIIESLGRIGYEVYAKVLASRDYCVPQIRERIFIIAVERGTSFKWPYASKQEVTLRDAISDLPEVEPGLLNEWVPSGRPRNAFQRMARRRHESGGCGKVYDHYTRGVRSDDHEAFRMMDHRTRYPDLPEELRRYRSDAFTDKYKRLHWDSVSRTITAHLQRDGYSFIHPEQHRTLTVREAARIQTFPDWFRFSGSMGNAFAQIGNAVPPVLAETLGRSILRANGLPKAEMRRPSAGRVKEILAQWMSAQIPSSLLRPWHGGASLWHTVMGLVLSTDRNGGDTAREFWETYSQRWPSPEKFLKDGMRETAIRALGGNGAPGQLERVALILGSNGDSWDGVKDKLKTELRTEIFSRVSALMGKGSSLAALPQVVRVAERVFGEGLKGPKVNRQLALACLVGETEDPRIHGAMLEIADRLCLADVKHCGICPLKTVCSGAEGIRAGRARGTGNIIGNACNGTDGSMGAHFLKALNKCMKVSGLPNNS